MPGTITSAGISGSLDAKNIVLGVLEKAIEISNLQTLCPAVMVPELTATIPVATPVSVTEDVEELEYTQVETGAFDHVDFNLKKDRIKIVASDESEYRSKVGSPMDLQVMTQATALANVLDKKIVTAMETTPQTTAAGAAWSTVGNNPLLDLQVAVNKILPYKADYVIMHPDVHAKYVGNDFVKDLGAGAPTTLAGSITRIPGVELDIFVNSNVTAKSALVGATQGYPAVIGNGPVKVTKEYSTNLGAEVYQADVFRQVIAPIMKTSGGLNMAVSAITAVIA